MRAVLVLYMTKVFLLSDNNAYSIFAAFTALVYLTPIMGGFFADRLLGFKRSILLGGLFLVAGYGLLAIPHSMLTFYLGLGTVIIGNGFFKPNVSGIVGQLYKENDPRRDGGFTIFYAGINVGSLIPPLITAWVIAQFGWSSAFLMASSGVLAGLIIFWVGLRHHPDLGQPPATDHSKIKKHLLHIGLVGGSILGIVLSAELVRHTHFANGFLFILGSAFLFFTIRQSLRFYREQRDKLILCHILILFSVVFWALYQQAAMSLTIFTEYNVDRTLAGWQIPTILFQSVNPIFIILLGPLLSKFWLWLDKRNLDPSIPGKFAWATILMGAGFVVLPLALIFRNSQGEIAWSWIVLSYFLQTVGELLLSPIGLSMITKLSPPRLVGMMMGAWFFATALANSLAGYIAEWTTVPSGTNDPLATDAAFAHVFGLVGWIACGIGIILLLFVPFLKRLSHMESIQKE